MNTPAPTTQHPRRRGLVATLAGLGVAGAAVVAGPMLVSAQETDTTSDTTIEHTSTDDATSDERPAPFADVLAELVDDGTITQEQADVIAAKLAEHAGERGHGERGVGRKGDITVVTDLLGVTEDELRTELRAGSTLAEIAEANGVDTQTLIDTLVADAQTRLDEAVADGRLTEDEATEKAADLVDHVTDHVNGELEGRPGPRGADADADADADAEVSDTTDA